jgi:hypothetical protein
MEQKNGRRPRDGGAGLATESGEAYPLRDRGQGADAAAIYRLWVDLEDGVRKAAFSWLLYDRGRACPENLSPRAWAAFSNLRVAASKLAPDELDRVFELANSKSRPRR